MKCYQGIDLPTRGPLWVFGYGSLMWKPGFIHQHCVTARIYGYHRSLCVWSWVHRGTRQLPGLVFGLDHGGSCRGRLFQVPGRFRDTTLRYLRDREMVTSVYRPRCLPAYHGSGVVSALTFVVDREDIQYAGRLAIGQAADVARSAQGCSGANRDYLLNTCAHLQELGIRDPQLQQLCEQLRNQRSRGASPGRRISFPPVRNS